MAPEYAMEGLFSAKSNVFNFGVILLEILSGRRSSGSYLTQHGQTLLTYEDPADRPTMSFVVLALGSEPIALPLPKKPAYSLD
ncbi:hypothetical protein NC653_027080 [Populus alba x Populus x berolinensis]|uniref:Serine-threonine/tyrosine-protein kinase catalytic domain-containing protein n=1 Tax=Populus alba x Populus x berolinensis TaxID=444605 RepID=A0AAD6M4P6_9ROSI|nr:hypothetical protein NC653_027080 [Populus alba x Populus x berolinensis]